MKIVAIKRIALENFWEYTIVQVIREIQLMKELNTRTDGKKYVPIIYDVIVHHDKEQQQSQQQFSDPKAGKPKTIPTVFIIMEYFDTDLKTFIRKKLADLDSKQVLRLVHDCLQALRFLHQNNVVHRDIKPDNLFITHDLRVKIGDFGISRSLPENLTGKGSGNSLRVRNFIR